MEWTRTYYDANGQEISETEAMALIAKWRERREQEEFGYFGWKYNAGRLINGGPGITMTAAPVASGSRD